MSFEPEIIIRQDKDVLRELANPKTLTVCWDASQDEEFSRLMEHVFAFNDAAYDAKHYTDHLHLLKPLRDYAQSQEPFLDEIIESARLVPTGLHPLETWVHTSDDENLLDAATPHCDGPYIGVFFSFNTLALGSLCIPAEHAGRQTEPDTYADADLSKAVHMPPQSVYMVKLGEQVHASNPHVPEGAFRIFEHMRYHF